VNSNSDKQPTPLKQIINELHLAKAGGEPKIKIPTVN
jgi:hypothetical protein